MQVRLLPERRHFPTACRFSFWTKGRKPHPISLDDYYDDEGAVSEGCRRKSCILNVWRHWMSDSLMKISTRLLARGESRYAFFQFQGTGKEGIPWHGPCRLKRNDILVIEGIHGLNDKLSYTLPAESKFKIYISALTQLNIDEHNPLSTTDCRLLRRIVRDARTRGTTAQETIAMWKSVRRGEEKNILPVSGQCGCHV